MGQKQYKVNVITGPGNIYVTLAKKLVYGTVGIDSGGAFEVLVIADETANPVHLAADLLRKLNTINGSSDFVDDGYWFG